MAILPDDPDHPATTSDTPVAPRRRRALARQKPVGGDYHSEKSLSGSSTSAKLRPRRSGAAVPRIAITLLSSQALEMDNVAHEAPPFAYPALCETLGARRNAACGNLARTPSRPRLMDDFSDIEWRREAIPRFLMPRRLGVYGAGAPSRSAPAPPTNVSGLLEHPPLVTAGTQRRSGGSFMNPLGFSRVRGGPPGWSLYLSRVRDSVSAT